MFILYLSSLSPPFLSYCRLLLDLVGVFLAAEIFFFFFGIPFVQVQNAVEYLKIIGALDEKEELTVLGIRIFFDVWLKPFIIYLLILLISVGRTSTVYASSGAETWKDAYFWCHIQLPGSHTDYCCWSQCQRSFFNAI